MDRDSRPPPLLVDSFRAHTLQFGTPLAPAYDAAAGRRMLFAFLMVAVGLFFLLRFGVGAIGLRTWPATNLVFVTALLAAFVAAQRYFVSRPMADVGLRAYSLWTRRERLYFLQVVPAATVMFTLVFRDHLAALIEQRGFAGFLLFSVLTGLVWGMVQEFLYRGWLQTELTRRYGAVIGLIAANIVFTFGPLHLDYLVDPGGVRWAGLAAVFGIGLLFGSIYQRSGNLWIPALLHGIWPLNMS